MAVLGFSLYILGFRTEALGDRGMDLILVVILGLVGSSIPMVGKRIKKNLEKRIY